MSPRPDIRICDNKTACLAPKLQVSMGPSIHLWFCAFKRASLAPELQTLWGPDLTWVFVHANIVLSIRMTRLYVSQPPSVVFACKTATLGPELQVPMGSRPRLSFRSWKTV